MKLSIVDEKTYNLSGVTFKNSLIEFIIDNDTKVKYIVQSDEEGLFELDITDLLENSSVKSLIKDSEETIYTAEFTLEKHIQQLEKINHPENNQNLETVPSEPGNLTHVVEQPIEKPVETPVEKPIKQALKQTLKQTISMM